MLSTRQKLLGTIVATVMVTACAATPSPSPAQRASDGASAPVQSRPPAPSASALPSVVPAATAAPRDTAWPYEFGDSEPLFAPDGSVYFLGWDAAGADQRTVVALDVTGHVKPGWSFAAPPGSDYGSLVVAPDGSVYLEERGVPAVGNVVHRLDAAGREMPGWPFSIPSELACPAGPPFNTDDPRTAAADDPCYPVRIAVASDGTAYLQTRPPVRGQLLAIDGAGTVKAGWPIDLEGYDWADAVVADGGVYIDRRPLGPPSVNSIGGFVDDRAQLMAFGLDGTGGPGWPVPVPEIRGYLPGSHGNVVVWSVEDDLGELCSNPRRTVFTILGPDGKHLPGWPRGSTGNASAPVVGDDGTVYYVSATHRLYAHDLTGDVKAGWPVAVPGAGDACGPERPHLAPDGTIYSIGDDVMAVSADGRPAPGWPYHPDGQLTGPCLDSECYGGHGAPRFGPDGSIYFLVFHTDGARTRAEIVGLDRQGRPTNGWPYRLPFDPETSNISLPAMSVDGRLFVRTDSPNTILALDPDGTLSD